MTTPPLCLDCKHMGYAERMLGEIPRCLAPRIDPVYGEPDESYAFFCYEMRRFDGECGREGRLFEAKGDKA